MSKTGLSFRKTQGFATHFNIHKNATNVVGVDVFSGYVLKYPALVYKLTQRADVLRNWEMERMG